MESKSWYIRMIAWREMNIKERNFILILSFLVGVFAAIAAFLLKSSIHFIQNLLTENFSKNSVNYWYLVFPAVGISLTYLFVRFVVKDNISHGGGLLG